jgi:hypothetical protein
VGTRLGIAIEEGFASTVFWRMQDNSRLIASTLTASSPLFRMLPAPSFSLSPAAHAEDVQGLLDAVQFPLASRHDDIGGFGSL